MKNNKKQLSIGTKVYVSGSDLIAKIIGVYKTEHDVTYTVRYTNKVGEICTLEHLPGEDLELIVEAGNNGTNAKNLLLG